VLAEARIGAGERAQEVVGGGGWDQRGHLHDELSETPGGFAPPQAKFTFWP
jgi:hypothetical protein